MFLQGARLIDEAHPNPQSRALGGTSKHFGFSVLPATGSAGLRAEQKQGGVHVGGASVHDHQRLVLPSPGCARDLFEKATVDGDFTGHDDLVSSSITDHAIWKSDDSSCP